MCGREASVYEGLYEARFGSLNSRSASGNVRRSDGSRIDCGDSANDGDEGSRDSERDWQVMARHNCGAFSTLETVLILAGNVLGALPAPAYLYLTGSILFRTNGHMHEHSLP